MDGAYSASPPRPLLTRRRVIGVAVAALGVALVGLTVAALAWAPGYTPLSGTGTGVMWADYKRGVTVDPAVGSGGKPVYFPRYRPNGPFSIEFTVTNTGRFDVVLEGLPREPIYGAMVLPTRVRVLHRCCAVTDGVSLVDERFPVKIPAGEARTLHVDYRIVARCAGGPGTRERAGGYSWIDWIRLRYRYLRVFERTANVELPIALTLGCRGGTMEAYSDF
jgi:hypothetical protein